MVSKKLVTDIISFNVFMSFLLAFCFEVPLYYLNNSQVKIGLFYFFFIEIVSGNGLGVLWPNIPLFIFIIVLGVNYHFVIKLRKSPD